MRSCFHWERSSFCWCGWAAPSAVFWRVSRCWDSKRTSRRSNACCAARASLLLADYTRTLCKESGAEALGWCAGLAGRCLVLAAVFPLLEEVCQRIWGLAG